jgi:hypothetical protein
MEVGAHSEEAVSTRRARRSSLSGPLPRVRASSNSSNNNNSSSSSTAQSKRREERGTVADRRPKANANAKMRAIRPSTAADFLAPLALRGTAAAAVVVFELDRRYPEFNEEGETVEPLRSPATSQGFQQQQQQQPRNRVSGNVASFCRA